MNGNIFSAILANGIRDALSAAHVVGVSVYAEVESEHVDGNCVRVVTQSVEDLIPGNLTFECRGVVETRISNTSASGIGPLSGVLESVQRVVCDYLGTVEDGWEPEGSGNAPQVVQYRWWMGPNSTDNPYYVGGIEWRAVLQF